jgi:hypothetical protein
MYAHLSQKPLEWIQLLTCFRCLRADDTKTLPRTMDTTCLNIQYVAGKFPFPDILRPEQKVALCAANKIGRQ